MDTPQKNRIDFENENSPSGQSGSIVVWDTSPLSLLALAGVLDSQGYRIVCARDGEAAQKALLLGPQDLLVCDVGDDAAQALSTLATMRETEGFDQLPAIMIADAKWAGARAKM